MMMPWDLLGKAVDFVVEKFRDNSKPGPYVNPHYFPKTWAKMGLPNPDTCWYCKRQYKTHDRYAKPHCDEQGD